MTHVPKLKIPGAAYHVMARGNRKIPIFHDDRDRRRFDRIVADVAAKRGVEILAESQMTNHFHKVLIVPRGNVSAFMQDLNSRFAKYINRRYKEVGHLFQGPFRRVIIENDIHLVTEISYVLMNPVAAGMVQNVDEWKWSSYKATMGLAPKPPYLSLEWLPVLFGGADVAESRRRFCEFINSAKPLDTYLNQPMPAVGSPEFERAIRSFIGEKLHQASLPRSYRALGRPPLSELFPPGQPKSERNFTIRRAQVVHGYLLSEIARCLSLHPASVSRIVCTLRKPR